MILEDIRVLDFSHIYFGPYCTMILGDLGADIIKIEPPWGEYARQYPPIIGGTSADFHFLNRNKKSMTIDLKHPLGQNIIRKLVTKSDVIVENFRRGTMEKLGLSYEEVIKIKPDIIYASLSGFGLYGPYKEYTSFAPVAGSYSGWYRLTGDIIDPNGPPIRPAEWHGDLDPGLWAAIAILGAIRYKDKTGDGQLIDVSQLDCMIMQNGVSITKFLLSGELPWEIEEKSDVPNTFGFFKAKDGWLYVAAEPYMHSRILKAIKIDDLSILIDELEKWISVRSIKEVMTIFLSDSIPVAPVLQINETIEDEHVKVRNIIQEIHHPDIGNIRMPGFPVKLSVTPCNIRIPAPTLGQHNDSILKDILKYSIDEIKELRDKKVII